MSLGEIITERKQKGFNTEAWCADLVTICWDSRMTAFAGVRFLADLTLGYIVQNGKDRFVTDPFTASAKIGFEINLLQSWIAFQAVFIPGFTSTFDENSQIRQRLPAAADGAIIVDFGLGAGASFFDGIVSVGAGFLKYDTRTVSDSSLGDLGDGFVYFSFNPVAS